MSEKDELRDEIRTISKQKKEDSFGSRQNEPEEFLTNKRLREFRLLVPPLDPATLYSVVENSSTLASCIEAYIDNIDGFGYEFFYTGTKGEEKNEEVIEERKELSSFFKQVNENQSFIELRKELRRDYETTGNAYIEVIRYMDNEIATLYRADSKYMRLQVKQEEPVEVKVPLIRNGKVRQTPIKKKFRKFAMITNGGKYEVRWFKEYGDPRKMCAISGEYEEDLRKANREVKEYASEIIHFKQGNDIYGVPRWAGVIPVVRGLYKADVVNYDLFENQAIPPMVIMVSGGQLTKESWKDVKEMMEGLKGSENFHKNLVLEAEGTSGPDMGDKPTSASVDFKSLDQRDDLLFGNYIDTSEKRVRAKFRLPAFYLGITNEMSRACYSDDTETLTENGWKYYWEINPTEKIATFNPENGKIEYHDPIGDIYLKEYKGPMIHFNNSNSDILVTPDHTMYKMPVGNGNKWQKSQAIDIYDKSNRTYFKNAPIDVQETENKDFCIPFEDRADAVREKVMEYRNIEGDFFLEFLGYFIGDGATYSAKNQYRIALGAHKQRKKDKFKFFTEYFKKYHEMKTTFSNSKNSSKEVYCITDKGLRNWLRSNCGDKAINKKIPDICMNLNQRQSKILLNGLLESDGTQDKRSNRKSATYYTTSKELANQVQILALRCGCRTKISHIPEEDPKHNDGYRVFITYKDHSQIHISQIDKVDYEGMVYCFEVPNHLFFTRRNGKVAIQGNTADSSKMIAEEQVFRPERDSFDEIINFTLMDELNAVYWKFKTVGPRLVEGETVIDAVGKFARAGALSTNDAIKLMNRVLDLDVTTYDSEWSEIPVAALIELIKKKSITSIEGVGLGESEVAEDGSENDTEEKSIDSKQSDINDLSDSVDELKEQLEEMRVILEDRY